MPNLNMNGPFEFSETTIETEILDSKIGNYALGRPRNNKHYVNYVGRSDKNLKERILDHISENYQEFWYSYASTSKEAFEKECRNYHDFGESKSLDNEIHPDKPSGTNYKCPVCGV